MALDHRGGGERRGHADEHDGHHVPYVQRGEAGHAGEVGGGDRRGDVAAADERVDRRAGEGGERGGEQP
ncbi:hypothetical protein [Nannocystis sp. SCPEA4]|uniref:hypothetical protein n=1 Tax=Nannocystis sp. SCPEA4 TaxID=2996787 RepID=UPI0022713AB3|nr:hypothetical protein [Nannocystis sp. SCPEA4]MCY1058667.1 hypothetical protein [Nannocystis sp. SCPEA4]